MRAFPLLLVGVLSLPVHAGGPRPSELRPVPQGDRAVDFQQFQGGPKHQGHVRAPAIDKPRIRWTARVGIQGWLSAPVVHKGLVLVPSAGTLHNKPDPSDGLYAIDAKTGKRRWFFETPADANGVAVHPGMGLAVVTSDDDHVYAVNVRTGKRLWKHKGKGKMYTHPLVLGDLIVVGDGGGTLWALAPDTGRVMWKKRLKGSLRGGAASDGKTLYAVTTQGDAIAVKLSGKVAWRKKLTRTGWDGKGKEKVNAYAAPVVDKAYLYITFARDTIYDRPGVLALHRRTGKVAWRATARKGEKNQRGWGNVRTSPALYGDELIYAEPYSADVVTLSAKTGDVYRRTPVGLCMFPQWASPVIATNTVYIPRFDGVLYALDAATHERRWALYLGGEDAMDRPPANPSPETAYSGGCEWDAPEKRSLYATPALDKDGTLYVGNGHDTLFAIEQAR